MPGRDPKIAMRIVDRVPLRALSVSIPSDDKWLVSRMPSRGVANWRIPLRMAGGNIST
jgi:hypothetical protein